MTHTTPGIIIDGEKCLTITEVAVRIGRCEMTAYRWIKAGKLPKSIDGTGLYKESEVAEYMARKS